MRGSGWMVAAWLVMLGMNQLSLAMETVQVSAEKLQRLGVETRLPQPVKTVPIGLVPAQVTVPPGNDHVISAPLAGVVDQVMTSRGEFVDRGKVLVRLDSPELLQHQQHLIDTWNDLTVAEAQHVREGKLFQAGIIANKRWLETEKSWRHARTAFTQARRELIVMGLDPAAIGQVLKTGKLNSRLVLRAADSGVVTALHVSVGERVSRAAPLVRVTATHPLWLELAVPVQVADRLSPGAEVRVEARHAKGVVQLVAPTVDPETQTVLVRAGLTESGGLQPGRKVTASLNVPASGVFKLPRAALSEHQGNRYVFVQVPGGFEVRPVTVVRVTTEAVYVEKGLQAQEAVVVKGVAALKAAWLGVGEGE